jgi:hypothetical protein
MRKPLHVSHADTSTPEAAQATAAELHHVADLVNQGQLHIRGGKEGKTTKDGWQTISFERKMDPSLTDT